MSCNRAHHIELADFLAEPRAERFAEFRDHYPRCAACAAEVRAWTELSVLLRPEGDAHPQPEDLLRYADGALAAAERSSLSAHLEGCARCRDELAALGRFEPTRAGAVSAPRARPSLLDGLRRLVLHPAFAYALLLLVAAPALYDLAAPGVPAPSPAEMQAPSELDALEDRPLGRRSASREKKEQRAPEPAALQQRVEAPAAKAAAAAKRPPRAEHEAFADADLAEERVEADEPASSDAMLEAEGGVGRSRASQVEVRREELRALGYVVAGSSLPFEPRQGGGGRVRVPLLQGHGESRVRLISPDTRRFLEEVVADDVAEVALELPATWHEPGAWRVERRTGALTDVFWVTVAPVRR
jgi:hypothetical protein